MAVPEVVDPDPLDLCGSCPAIHFMMKIALGDREDAILLFQPTERFQVILHLVAEKRRHPNRAVAFFRLRRRDNILAVQALIGFVDLHGAFFEIEIAGCQRQ